MSLCRNIKWFLYNIWVLRKSLWGSRVWDSEGLLYLHRDYLKAMIKRQKEDTLASVDRDDYIHQMNVCINLIDRIVENNYYKWDIDMEVISSKELESGLIKQQLKFTETPMYPFPTIRTEFRRKRDWNQKKVDLELLLTYYRKHLFKWWT